MHDVPSRRTFAPALIYQDPKAALAWLEKAFGLQPAMVITTPDGQIAHAEMSFGDGHIMIGGEWTDAVRSPKSAGGKGTQIVHMHMSEDIDAHCARAKAAGATIGQEPETQFYGDRTYRAFDLEGHMWSFGQTVKKVSREEAEAATGLKIEGWV